MKLYFKTLEELEDFVNYNLGNRGQKFVQVELTKQDLTKLFNLVAELAFI